MSTEVKAYLQYLQGRETLSIADLQYAMQCSYPQAREAMQLLRKNGFVSTAIQGISSAVNTQLRDRRSMTREQARALVAELTSMELMTLDVVFNGMQRGGYRYDPMQDADQDESACLEKLNRMHLIHAFEGVLYPSIDDEAHDLIRKADQSRIFEPTILLFAIPVLDKAVALKDEPHIFYQLSMIPEACKAFVREHFARFMQTGMKPDILTEKLECARDFHYILAEDMIRALLENKPDLNSAEAYVSHAQLCARKMRNMDMWEDVVYDALNDALETLSGMSLEDIRCLQNGQDDDDDDDDD